MNVTAAYVEHCYINQIRQLLYKGHIHTIPFIIAWIINPFISMF